MVNATMSRLRFDWLKGWAIPVGLLALALLVRVPGLGTFNTVDEPRWIYRSGWFVSGLLFPDTECPPLDVGRSFASSGWGCTFQSGHPGVTTMWGGGLGLLAHYWQAVWPTGVDLRTFLADIDPLDADLVAPVRLPLAVLAALFVPAFYVLLRRLLDARVAVVAALLVALNPLHIALSRVLHHDALTATFMVLSILAMLGYWLQGWKWYWLLISAGLAGMAFLTKPVSWFLMPYAALAGCLGLAYRWQRGQWRGRRELWRLLGEGMLWAVVAWLTCAAFFPAMWVMPGEVIRRTIGVSTQFAQEGHEAGTFFLGRTSQDPGPLYYPLGWLLQASPLEILGLLMLPAALWGYARRQPARNWRRALISYPVPVALALFLATFLLFMTLSSKKMVRYFLPALPVLDIFAAWGLLWLWDRLLGLARRPLDQRWRVAWLAGAVLVVQGWLALDNYPYYFSYYNPLFGGAPGAARIIGIGWGEGMDQAAAYLNQQPGAESLHVAAAYHLDFMPFFVGETVVLSDDVGDQMNADYLVYYQHQLQRQLQQMDVWRYFEEHYAPVQRVTLQGLDYALVYRNPIQHHVDWRQNGLPGDFRVFGYNLAEDGSLRLFWQNEGLAGEQKLWAGLVPANEAGIRWVACAPGPGFDSEVDITGAIVESLCPLSEADPVPGFYDLYLGLGDGAAVSPVAFPAGLMAVTVDPGGGFTHPDRGAALAWLIEQGLAAPLRIVFGDTARWIGYQLEPPTWQPGRPGRLTLYWEMSRRLPLRLVNAFELALRLSAEGAAEPSLVVVSPVFPPTAAARDLAPGAVVPVDYALELPGTLAPGPYGLDVCLRLAGSGQPVAGLQDGTSEPIECLRLSVEVKAP